MTTIEPTLVYGSELRVGDMVLTWYGTHLLTAIEPYPKWGEMFPGHRGTLLEFDGGRVLGMSADDGDRFEVLREGGAAVKAESTVARE